MHGYACRRRFISSRLLPSTRYSVKRSATMALTRREFLCRSFGAFGAAVLTCERFGLLQALAQPGDYKALVCIFLFGGNDSGNMIIPYDDYATYASIRGSSGLAVPQSSLLPITVPSLGSRFAFHPSLAGLQIGRASCRVDSASQCAERL